jgi:hypothetical protein
MGRHGAILKSVEPIVPLAPVRAATHRYRRRPSHMNMPHRTPPSRSARNRLIRRLGPIEILHLLDLSKPRINDTQLFPDHDYDHQRADSNGCVFNCHWSVLHATKNGRNFAGPARGAFAYGLPVRSVHQVGRILSTAEAKELLMLFEAGVGMPCSALLKTDRRSRNHTELE